jgi:hypothetical protein
MFRGKVSIGFLAQLATTAALLAAPGLASAAEPDKSFADWLGKEITINTSSFDDHIPTGGKMTLIFDAGDNVVRVCTRSVTGQKVAWRMDFAGSCSIALSFTKGTRYCTAEDIKAGNAEVLSSCHRLRSNDIAMHPAAVKGALELHDLIVFLIPLADNKHGVSILVDSPARVIHGGSAGGHD